MRLEKENSYFISFKKKQKKAVAGTRKAAPKPKLAEEPQGYFSQMVELKRTKKGKK